MKKQPSEPSLHTLVWADVPREFMCRANPPRQTLHWRKHQTTPACNTATGTRQYHAAHGVFILKAPAADTKDLEMESFKQGTSRETRKSTSL